MRVPLAQVGGIRGFPVQILNRELKTRDLKSFTESLAKVAGRFGQNPEDVIQKMVSASRYRRLNKLFWDLKDTDHPLEWQESWNKDTTPIREIWEELTADQKAAAQTMRLIGLEYWFDMKLSHGKTRASLAIHCMTMGEVRLNPKTISMEGEILTGQHNDDWPVFYFPDGFSTSVSPKITKDTRHSDLLEIRRKAQVICAELGFPPPFSLQKLVG